MESAKKFAQAVYDKLKAHEDDFYKLEDVCLFVNRNNSIIAFSLINLAFLLLYLLHMSSYSYMFTFLGLYFLAQYFLPIISPILRKLLLGKEVQEIPEDSPQRYTIKEVSSIAGTVYFLAHKEMKQSLDALENQKTFAMFLTLFALNFVFYFFLSIPDPLTLFLLLNGLLLLPYLLQQKLSQKLSSIQERFVDLTEFMKANEEAPDQLRHDIGESDDENEPPKEHAE